MLRNTAHAAAAEYERALSFFEAQDYAAAGRILAGLAETEPRNLAVRQLLARAYYHSAQLDRAVDELRTLLAQDPADAYAHLVLGRTLERQSRPVEAARHLSLARAMGLGQHC
jgi:predicted Zn-dependent protease